MLSGIVLGEWEMIDTRDADIGEMRPSQCLHPGGDGGEAAAQRSKAPLGPRVRLRKREV